jgi:ribosomal protein S18 acetylase RimI-like enzyme
MAVTISLASADDAEELTEAFARLIPHLSRSNPPPTREQVDALLAAQATSQFVARGDDGRIVGVATLIVFRIPTALRAWVEDVVADPAAAGQGVGRALTEAMIVRARELGCKTVELTSRPSREAANHIYRSVGFTPRETNVYRLTLEA